MIHSIAPQLVGATSVMEESNESNEVSRFRPPKSGEEESKLLKESIPNQQVTRINGLSKFSVNGR